MNRGNANLTVEQEKEENEKRNFFIRRRILDFEFYFHGNLASNNLCIYHNYIEIEDPGDTGSDSLIQRQR